MHFFHNIKRYFEPLGYRKSVIIIWLLCYLGWSLNGIVHVLFLERFVQLLWANETEAYFDLIQYYILYVIWYSIFLILFHRKWWNEIPNTIEIFLQNKYMSRYVKLENNAIEKQGTGKLIAIIDNGIQTWSTSINSVLVNSMDILVTLSFACFMIGKNSGPLLLVFFLLYVVFFVLASWFNKRAVVYRRQRRDFANLRKKNLVKILMSKNEILSAEKIDDEVANLDEYSQKQIYYNKKMSPFVTLLHELPSLVMISFIIFLFYTLGNQYFAGETTIAEIVWITAAFGIMQRSLSSSLGFYKEFTNQYPDIEKLREFFHETPDIEWYSDGRNFEYQSGKIELKDIDYTYKWWKKLFKNFNLSLKKCDVTAFVWPSGWGKSTLVKLIAGYLKPDAGEVIVDWQKLSEVNLKSYYKNLGYLTQEPNVFDGTIYENLTYSLKKQVNEKKMHQIIELAKCEFIYGLEDGLETEVGEKWVRLSGWQKQRLAIAKIFLRDPDILILDEPTSALDSLSEKKISEAMANLFEWRTVIIIAHRLQTVKDADCIVYIKDGEVLEQWNHSSLIKNKNGLYKKMLDLQSGF